MGNIEKCLQEQGFAVVPIRGTSMWPLLKTGESLVQVAKRDGQELREGEIVLYRRDNGTLVLHRIIRAEEDGSFHMCGDHQWNQIEKVQEDQILAVAQGFYRNGHFIDDKTRWYRLYKKIWNGNLTVRRCCLAFLRLSGIEKISLK